MTAFTRHAARPPRLPAIYAHRKGYHERTATYPERLGAMIAGLPIMPDILMRSGDSRLAIIPTDPLRNDPAMIDWDDFDLDAFDLVEPRPPTKTEMLEAESDALPLHAVEFMA